ncbi:BBE domain-containing protein [Streptomyces viridochromogenes]|nr:BBE domain-containing protein [Streptomyces viridochromogenes]
MINILSDDQSLVRADYRTNHARPRELKRRYDPGNLFRLNNNTAP